MENFLLFEKETFNKKVTKERLKTRWVLYFSVIFTRLISHLRGKILSSQTSIYVKGDEEFCFFRMLIMIFGIFVFFLASGCSLSSSHKGLVTSSSAIVTIVDVHEKSRRIISDETAILQQLDGCIVEVEGMRFGKWMIEQNWRILDAGDGSFPFLGKIEQRGIQYFIHDHNTQSMFRLDGDFDFSTVVDKNVLVVGFVIGSHDVRVLRIVELK